VVMNFVCPTIKDYIGQCESDKDGVAILERKGFIKKLNLTYGFRVVVSRHCTIKYDLERVLDYVLMVTEFVGGLYWSTPINFLTIDLWLTPLRKIWCPEAEAINLIGKCHVNSGDTAFPHHDKRHIRVWRAEDWSKVVLHELFHAFNWDRLVPQTEDNQSEALVETMAVLLHCQFLGGITGWRKLLDAELGWMKKQVATLSRHRWEPDKTSVRSYYILKTALLSNLDEFSRWLKQPSPVILRQSWVPLATTSVQTLLKSIHPTQHSTAKCLSMRMVFSQLSLNPLPIRTSPEN
jgi:hypothetical protein